MSLFKNTIILLVIIGFIELAYVGAYYYQTSGPLRATIQEHTQNLHLGTIPPVETIDLKNDAWVKVAHFETVMSQIGIATALVISILVAWFFLKRGMSRSLKDRAVALSGNKIIQNTLYLIFMSVLSFVIFMPMIFSGYAIGQMRGTDISVPSGVAWDVATTSLIDLIYLLLTFVPLYWIMEKFKARWWIMGATFVALFSLFTGFISPIVIDPLFTQLAPIQEGTLKDDIMALSAKAQVPVDRIYVNDASVETLESNATVYGIGPTKRVELDDTLLIFYSNPEIVFIVAHELGHYVHKDILFDMVFGTLETFVSFAILAFVLRFYVRRWGRKERVANESDIVLFPLIGLTFAIYGFAMSPIDSYISRTMESRADEYAIEITQNPEAGISGFKKLAYQSFVDPEPPQWLHVFFDSHPTFAERLNMLESAKNRGR